MTNTALKLPALTSNLVLGLNPPISNALYHSDRVYKSSSVLKSMYKDIGAYHLEYELGIREEKKESPALAEGSLTHTFILEPHTFNQDFVVYPGFDKREANYKVWKSQLGSDTRIIISASQLAKVKGWVKAFEQHPIAKNYVTGGEPEQTITALYDVVTGSVSFNENDENENTVRLKVRFDYVNEAEGYISDVKTTKEPAGPECFTESAFNENSRYPLMYDLSAALYLLVAEAYYKRRLDFYFLVISKQDVACDVYKLSGARRAAGLSKVNMALRKYLKARQSGVWKETEAAKPALEIVEI